MAGKDRDFFVRHYKDPIFEDGIQCRDMVRLVYHTAPDGGCSNQ